VHLSSAERTVLGVVGAFLVSLVVVVVLGLALQPAFVHNGPTTFDANVTRWFVDHRTDGWTALMRAMTWLGSSWVIIPLTVIVVTLLALRHPVALAIYLALGVAGASLLSTLAKRIIGRDRPPEPVRLAHITSSSFPSGHATQAAATYLALAIIACCLAHGTRSRVLIWVAAASIIALVGVSRVYLGVHWATDVLGGWFLGAMWVGGLTLVFRPSERAFLPGSPA
jgi:undecaprenyl-diphosphatase